MSFDPTGKYNRLYRWTNDRDAGIKILAERMDNEFDGVAQALTQIVQGVQSFTQPIKVIDGTVTAPAIAFSNDPDTGLFRKADGAIAFSIDGVQMAEVTPDGHLSAKIDGADLDAGTVATAKLADGAVTEAKLADGAVATAKLADGAVTEAKVSAPFVKGPSSSTNGNFASFNGTDGKTIQDSGVKSSDVVQGPASVTSGNIAVFDGATGKLLKDAQNVIGAAVGKKNHLTIGGQHWSDGGNDFGITVQSFEPAIGFIARSGGGYKTLIAANQYGGIEVLYKTDNADGDFSGSSRIFRATPSKLDYLGYNLWHDNNIGSRISALTEDTSPSDADYIVTSRGKKVALGNVGGPDFESGALSWNAPGTGTKVGVAHGLGARPRDYDAFFVCKTANNGYSVGEEVKISHTNDDVGLTVVADASNITVLIWDVPWLPTNASSPSYFQPSPAYFNLIVRAKK